MAGPRDPENADEPETDVEGADLDAEEEETVSPDVMSVHHDDKDRRIDIQRD